MGVDSSMRRPTWLTILSMIRRQVLIVAEGDVGQLEQAPAFDVDLLAAVHQDVGDGRVLQQRLERTQAEHFVQHFVADLLLFDANSAASARRRSA